MSELNNLFGNLVDLFQATSWAWIAFCATLGLCVGSFLNVVAYRLPIMMENEFRTACDDYWRDQPGSTAAHNSDSDTSDSAQAASSSSPNDPMTLSKPASSCPHCGHRIRFYENIPVLSWLLLRGRCSSCRNPISVRYPLVEIVAGVLAGFAAWHFGPSAQACAAIALLWLLLVLSLIDLDVQLLPNDLVYPGLWLGLLVNLDGLFVPLRDAVLGAVIGFMGLWLVLQAFKLATGKEGMGYGDLKLLAMLGAWMGYQPLLLIIILAAGTGAIIGVGAIAFRGRDRQVPIPFGPFLASGALVALFWGNELMDAYLGSPTVSTW